MLADSAGSHRAVPGAALLAPLFLTVVLADTFAAQLLALLAPAAPTTVLAYLPAATLLAVVAPMAVLADDVSVLPMLCAVAHVQRAAAHTPSKKAVSIGALSRASTRARPILGVLELVAGGPKM
jgi:hypothetical protein